VTSFVEEEGSYTNSSRCIMWKWKGADPFGESRTDIEILSDLFVRIRALYEEEGGPGAEPLLAVDWSYADPAYPNPDELLRELNGKALADVRGPDGAVIRRAGEQLNSFGEMRDDGSTDGSMWIYTGVYGPKGNFAQRRENTDPSGLGVYGDWGFSWPANRRIQYNRASADPQGRPWSEAKKYMYWDGQRWTGPDVPDYVPTIPPDRATGPFIMNAEGVSRLWTRGLIADGPFPAHYEPFESPVKNPLFPNIRGNPVSRIFNGDMEVFGSAEEFPIVATTYRLTEHFHYWTKSVHANAVLQPEFFVEMSEELASEKGIEPGQMVRVRSHRGEVKGRAFVTKRMVPLQVDGKTVHQVGLPLNFGFIGLTRKAAPINSLTAPVADANANTPEYKAFLVDVEPIAETVA
jgi:formate dehydrogenase major subunit